MNLGFGLGLTMQRPAAGGGPPPLGTITVDSASLQMPDGNQVATNAAAPSYLADGANWAPTGNKIFNPAADCAFAAMVEIPWEAISMTASQFVGVLGNLSTATALNQTFGIRATRGATDQETPSITFAARDGLGITLTGTINVSLTQRRLLLVARMVSGQMMFEVYHHGVLVGSVSPTMSTFAVMQLRSQLCYGAMGSGTTTGYGSSGSLYGFNGSIAWVGYRDAALTQADCQAMSLGADPLVQVSAAAWRMYRRIIDTGATSLAKPAAATGDATVSMVVINSRALAFRKGSDLNPAASGATWLRATSIRDGRVFGISRGNSTGRIFLSGDSSGLSGGVQARVFDAVTGQLRIDWTTVVGASLGGAWSGYVDSPVNSGWGHIDIRATATPALVQRVRARTGVGHVLGIMGQSQLYRMWQYPATVATTAVGAVSTVHVPTRSATTYGLLMQPITAERPLNESLAYVTTWLANFTTAPVMIINCANPGQGVAQLVNDADTGWNWSELEAVLAMAIGPFVERTISGLAINWLTNFANDVNLAGNGIIGNHIRPLIEGVRDAGATTTFPINHYLRDGLTFPANMDIALSVPSRYSATAVGPYDFSGQDTSAANHGTGRSQWLAYQAAYPSVVRAVGPWANDIRIEAAGGPHENLTALEGHPRLMARCVEAALRAAGVVTRTTPSLGSAAINGGRTAITITPTLPNGGALQTAWSLKAVAVPGGETTVQGFEVQDGGAGAWTRSGFTAEIVGGNLVLTKSATSWAAGTKVRYAVNGPLDYGTTGQELLMHGALYESGFDEGGLGQPLAGAWSATV